MTDLSLRTYKMSCFTRQQRSEYREAMKSCNVRQIDVAIRAGSGEASVRSALKGVPIRDNILLAIEKAIQHFMTHPLPRVRTHGTPRHRSEEVFICLPILTPSDLIKEAGG